MRHLRTAVFLATLLLPAVPLWVEQTYAAQSHEGRGGWAVPAQLGQQGPAFYRWKRFLLNNTEEVAIGCSYRDCIPPIEQPNFVSAAQTGEWLEPRERVVGLSHHGAIKAYPLKVLNYHEVVDDTAGETPILLSYCPLCGSALAFRRVHNGQTLTFGVSGLLHHSNLVLYDRETESFWDQITGEAIAGPLVGGRLEPIPVDIVPWSAWKRAYPDTLVLSLDTGYDRPYDQYPYGDYRTSNSVYFNTDFQDSRLHPKDRVIGVALNDRAKAYPQAVLDKHDNRNVIHDILGDTPILVVQEPASREVHVFKRRVDGRELTFRVASGALVDRETGSRWTFDGRARGGTFQGRQLEELAATPVFWFAWATYHPGTALYASQDAPSGPLGWMSVHWSWLLLGLGVVLASLTGTWLRLRRWRHAGRSQRTGIPP